MLRRTLPLLILLLLAGALPVAAAPDLPTAAPSSSSAFQALGCYDDPQGDATPAQADLVEVCARYFAAEDGNPAALVVSFITAAPVDPLQDAAWGNPGTAASVALSVDGDDVVDRTLRVTRDGTALQAVVTDGGGEVLEGCGLAQAQGGGVLGQILASCMADAASVRFSAVLTHEAVAGEAVSVDRVPDDALTAPLPQGDEPPVCANASTVPGGAPDAALQINRVACGIGGTEPVSQAAATSQFVFDNPATAAIDPYQADWAVIARDDDFADALAGASLSFGQGPLLFTYSPVSTPPGRDAGLLADITRAELLRVLPRGKTVYLLGGEAALAPGLVGQLESLGYEVHRFAGVGREQTARLISAEVRSRVSEFSAATGFMDPNMVLIANRANWPDAVLAGSLGAFWGMPVLLVDAVGPAHAETLAALDELRPDYIHIIGGRAVVGVESFLSILDHARANGYGQGRAGEDVTTPGTRWVSFCSFSPREGEPVAPQFTCRWGGDNRILTGAAVGQFNRDMVGRFVGEPFIPANPQQYAVAVSLAGGVDSLNFTHVLAAATVSGRFGGAVFIPTDDGVTLTDGIRNALCTTPGSEGFIEQVEQVVMVGDSDLLTNDYAQQIRGLVEGGCAGVG